MLRKFLDYQLSLVEKGKALYPLRPLIVAGDTFLYESSDVTKKGPHIRDAVDIKRWMLLVVVALIPCILMGIWNSGIQQLVYSSGDFKLMDEFLASTGSLSDYAAFSLKNDRWMTILKEGMIIFLPLTIVCYAVGGFWEAVFACWRGHDISEGFLVTGILYVLIMPPTIPLWMAAVGISFGVIFAKEVFGGSGMNIINPALAARAFVFFAYPGRMSGNVWVGNHPTVIRESLIKMNLDAGKSSLDGYTQATKLAQYNVPPEIKKIHIDALATNNLGEHTRSYDTIKSYFDQWNTYGNHQASLGELTQDQMRHFITSPLNEGGLGLSSGFYEDAYRFSQLNYGFGETGDWGFFLGNKLGCIGETSTLACLLGGLFLIYTGVGSWRTMVGMGLGAFFMALLIQFASTLFGADGGAWNPATLGFPAYKHLLLGGLAFGLVFMATDPVSSASVPIAKYIFGAFSGIVAIVIRTINPAFPEGVMLAILMGNVFAPLFDYYAVKFTRTRRLRRVRATAA